MNSSDRGDIEIFETPGELAQALADLFVDAAQSAITERGGFYAALAGGTTPKAAYELLAQEPRSNNISWKDVFIYFGDERCVPPDDPESNYLMAKKAFLDQVNIPMGNVHRMHGEEDPKQAAIAYTAILHEDLGAEPRFDLIMLGMGPDGHTASLFPGNIPSDSHAIVAAPYVEKFQSYRLTLTPRVINNARQVVIATEGPGKAPALAAVLKGPIRPEQYPVQIVRPTNGHLVWLIDRAAAGELET